jgi:hypothetical protein
MKHGTLAMVALLAVAGTAFQQGASAQTSVGGPTKQTAVGGPTRQTSPVVPSNKGGSTPVTPPPTPVKCSAGACTAKGTHR